ncbi:fibronectin type III domain-containing protein, partial [Patescibacteria group bacterium]|nr:fibronectin type III domain-containing protein [Patescibacteria group bacterium]
MTLRLSSFFGAVIIFSIACFCFIRVDVQAATLTEAKDIMTRQKTSNASNHEIQLVTPTGVDASTDTITLTFGTGFDLTTISFSDFALSHGATTGFETSETLAASAAAGVWGVSVSGQIITLTAPTDAASGEIAAGQRVVVRIGTAAGGVSQITNPSAVAAYSLMIGGVFGDTGQIIIPIASNDLLTVSATIPASSGGGGAGVSGGDTGGGGAVAGPPPPPPPAPPVSEPPPPTIVTPPVVPSEPPPPTIVTPPPAGGVLGGVGGVAGGGGAAGGAGSGGGGGGSGVSTLVFRDARVAFSEERSIVLTWETDRPASALIEYGVDDYSLRVTEEVSTRIHTLRINGLQPDTLYQFRITARAGGQVVSRRVTARTLPDVTPPTNPSELRAIGQEGQVVLEWVNPISDD